MGLATMAIVGLWGWSLRADAAEPSPDATSTRVVVQAEGCEGLAPAEVGRLLDLELALVTTEIRSGPPLTVLLQCEAGRMTINVIDPLTRKRLARDIPAPAPEPGRERVVAVAIGQLFAASWLELLTASAPPASPEDEEPPPDVTAVEAARRVAEERTIGRPVTPPPRRELELLLGAGARGRALQSAGRLGAGRVEALLRGWLLPSVGLVAVLGWDVGQTTRALGRVRGQAITAGGGLAWGWRPGAAGVGGHLMLAGGYARVRGLPRDAGVPASARAGITGDATLGVGPRFRYGRLRFDIDAEVGLMLRQPLGLVEGGPPMTMGGLWAGLVLRLGAALLR